MGQKLAASWWTRRNIDLKFSDVIKYAVAAGSGIPHLVWNTDTQDQDLIPEDPRDVLPIRPSDMISIAELLRGGDPQRSVRSTLCADSIPSWLTASMLIERAAGQH